MKSPSIKVDATLELDLTTSEEVDSWSIEELQGKMWECIELSLPVSLRRGEARVSGTLRFVAPTPYELKLARLKDA